MTNGVVADSEDSVVDIYRLRGRKTISGTVVFGLFFVCGTAVIAVGSLRRSAYGEFALLTVLFLAFLAVLVSAIRNLTRDLHYIITQTDLVEKSRDGEKPYALAEIISIEQTRWGVGEGSLGNYKVTTSNGRVFYFNRDDTHVDAFVNKLSELSNCKIAN